MGQKRDMSNTAGITADVLNEHFAQVSTHPSYTIPVAKLTTASENQDYFSEWAVLKALYTLLPTATGLDLLPAWFLRLGAPAFYKRLKYLFNKSIATSTVPLQWKNAIISPVPKISSPKDCNDYRPISVTPVLTRTTEMMVVRTFMYPALLTPTAGVDVL